VPRVSKAQSQANHLAIEAAASRLFRERGPSGVSVAEVMAEAGLTHGGFYAHYPSKDALAAAACAAAFAQAAAMWQSRIETARDGDAARRAIADGYLRETNRDPRATACPTAALATDVAREPAGHPIHAAYVDGVRSQLAVLAALGPTGDAARNRADACVQLATMMGALLLARATHGDPIAEEIVASARRHLAAAATREAPPPIPPRSTPRRRGLPRSERAS
jgi:TetR/AcrR family transcriptional repressor of nem operon